MDPNDLIYDWNRLPGSFAYAGVHVELDDETLRDGLQNPTVKDPPIERKIEMLHLIAEMGIQAADIGLPGAGPRAHQYYGEHDATGWHPSMDLYGGGGLLADARDLGRFLRLLMAGKVYEDEATLAALRLNWKVCKHVKSNAIVLADQTGTLGIGAGQMSRVDSVRLAIRKAADQDLSLTAPALELDSPGDNASCEAPAHRAAIR